LKSPLGYSTGIQIANISKPQPEIIFQAADLIFELTLPLLMLWVTTNYTHNSVAPNNFAVTADFLHGRTNFHCYTP